MNKSESKYFNTALLMDRALLQLLEVKDMEYISVKEICAKAGVNRSTFYLHYETISDLLEETTEYIYGIFLSKFDRSPEAFLKQIKESPLNELVLIDDVFLEPYLSFVVEHRSVFKAAFKNPVCMQSEAHFANMKEYILKPILERFGISQEEQSYWIAYYISGVTAIVREWVEKGCKEPVEKIGNIIKNCVRPQSGLENKKYEA